MARPWIFLINPFAVATRDSYRAMKKIGDFTVNAVGNNAGDPFFNTLIAALAKPAAAYNTAYIAWLAAGGAKKGQTNALKTLLATLSSVKAEDWDIAVQNIYRQHTPQYITLFPRHRILFQSGSQEDRIAAVDTLAKATATDPALAAVSVDVADFAKQLHTAYTAQKGGKSGTGVNSDNVEAARITYCTALYGVLGLLMNNYSDNPDEVANYFDLETIRNHEQQIFNHAIDGSEQLVALTHTFAEGETLDIANNKNTVLQFARVANKNDAMPAGTLTLQPMQKIKDLPADKLGSGRYLIVQNIAATEAGAYTIEL